MSSLSRQQMVNFVGHINIQDKDVFDIGAGPEKYWAKNWAKGTPKKYVTLDINKDFNVDFTNDVNYPFDIEQKFDTVFCFETLEHVWNPLQAVRNVYEHTKKGGTMYFSTPFINPIHDTHDFLRYTDEWYKKVFSEYLDVKEVRVYERIATQGLVNLLQFYAEEGLRMSKIRLKAGESHKLGVVGYFVEVVK